MDAGRWESTNTPRPYGNGAERRPHHRALHHDAGDVASTWTINSTTAFDARFGFLRWDYDREPGNLGINLTQTFGFPQTPYGEISSRSGIPGMETIPNIQAGANQTINTGLLYADDRTYSFTPTLTKITGAHTFKVGANLLRGGQLLPEQQPWRRLPVQQHRDRPRRHESRRYR